jgi:DNA-binding winged helix-turn-helix (wHTH) protein
MSRQTYEFDGFRISSVRRLVWRAGEQIYLSGREFDTLLALIQQAGTPIRGDDLTRVVWQDDADHAGNLRRQVSFLRRKLGKDANGNDYIRTIPNYGYQFASTVVCREETAPIPAPVVEDTAPRREPGRPRLAWPVIAAAVVALVIGSAFAWRSWPKELELISCRQLTRDGLVKNSRILTDGDRYYLAEFVKGNYMIGSLPLKGGPVDYLKFPWASTDAVGLSLSRHTLIVRNMDNGELWELELGSQRLRQIPLPVGAKPQRAIWEPAGNHLAVVTEGNTLIVSEPGKNREPLRLSFPGQVGLSGWDSPGGRLRFAVFDPITEMTRWWELKGTDRTPRQLAHFSSARTERDGA